MQLSELLEFIKEEDLRLRGNFTDEDEKFRTLSRMCKVAEEVGELTDEVLKSIGQARREKLATAKHEDLADEFADVIISTLLLASITRVDIEAALDKKITKIKNRSY